MRVAELSGVGAPLSVAERPVPEPGPGEILVKVTACGMCYSEVNLLNGEYPFARFPVVPGHEITGVVAALGPGVEWPAAGTAVGTQFLYSSCGQCDYCVRGDQILCLSKKITGIGADGGYGEDFIGRAGFVTPLPDGLDPVAGAPLMCAGITAFNGLRQARIRPGTRVAVLGAGGVGAIAARFAAAMGARVAILGRSRDGEARAKALGAELYVATGDTDPAGALDPAARGREQAGGVAQERGLARAVAAHQRDALAGGERQIHPAQDRRSVAQLVPHALHPQCDRDALPTS